MLRPRLKLARSAGSIQLFPYLGGKTRIARRYPAPRYSLIIEPFAGGAAYSLCHACRHPRLAVHLNDMNADVMRVWRFIQQADPRAITALPNLAVGAKIADIPHLSDEERLLLGLWANTVAGGRLCQQVSGWSRKAWHARKIGLARTVSLLRHWQITFGDYLMLENVEATWFIDPPYQGFVGYTHGGSGVDYARLAEWCRARRGQVIVCEREGAAWLPFTPLVRTRGQTNTPYWEMIYTQ